MRGMSQEKPQGVDGKLYKRIKEEQKERVLFMAKITKEIVLEVKRYMEKYPNLSQKDISKLVGCSQASVSDIKQGVHDHLLIEKPAEERFAEVGKMNEEKSEDHIPEVKKMVRTEIPYEEFRELVACKYVIGEIFANMKKSTQEEGTLFIDYKILSKILKRDLPEMYDARIEELSEGYVCTNIY